MVSIERSRLSNVVRLLKLVTGVEISTLPVRNSGNAGKAKNRASRRRVAVPRRSALRSFLVIRGEPFFSVTNSIYSYIVAEFATCKEHFYHSGRKRNRGGARSLFRGLPASRQAKRKCLSTSMLHINLCLHQPHRTVFTIKSKGAVTGVAYDAASGCTSERHVCSHCQAPEGLRSMVVAQGESSSSHCILYTDFLLTTYI